MQPIKETHHEYKRNTTGIGFCSNVRGHHCQSCRMHKNGDVQSHEGRRPHTRSDIPSGRTAYTKPRVCSQRPNPSIEPFGGCPYASHRTYTTSNSPDMKRIVYHGATLIVKEPLCHIGRNHLGFGKGFYLTDLRKQAVSWATRVANIGLPQWLNIYELNMDFISTHAKCKIFQDYDEEWLQFIVDSRNGGKPWHGYDYIEGGIADDRVITTIEDYINGDLSMEGALKRLSEHQPNNQICILSQGILDQSLRFIEAEPLNDLAQRKEEQPC